jgi:hypothetical protein
MVIVTDENIDCRWVLHLETYHVNDCHIVGT